MIFIGTHPYWFSIGICAAILFSCTFVWLFPPPAKPEDADKRTKEQKMLREIVLTMSVVLILFAGLIKPMIVTHQRMAARAMQEQEQETRNKIQLSETR